MSAAGRRQHGVCEMGLAEYADRKARKMLEAGGYEPDPAGHDGARLFFAVRDLMIYAASLGYDPRYLGDQGHEEALVEIHAEAEGLPKPPEALKASLAAAIADGLGNRYSSLYGAFQDANIQHFSAQERLAAYVWAMTEDDQ